ncbi:hypothetical protein NC651_008265 [Populus alba x Populus x berolinensis]|nr:hypothetical protein NC651_008265 [Populus alba x Populus x berolinensis]
MAPPCQPPQMTTFLTYFIKLLGATTPFFTAIFAFLITCNKELAEVYCAPLPVVFGIVLASNSEHLFHLFGFLEHYSD